MASLAEPGAVAVLETENLGGGVTALVTGRVHGQGPERFAGNLADHVGDDHTTVTGRRRALADLLRRDHGARTEPVYLRADHGVALAEFAAGPDGTARPVGAIPERFDLALTASCGLPLVALAADCVPFVVADPGRGVVLAGHAGWRGTAAGAMLRAVDAVTRGGGGPDGLRVLLGPAACGDCYQVGPEVFAGLSRPHAGGGDAAGWATADGTRWRVDLRRHLARQAERAGVPADRVAVSPRCTLADPELFSHRRDGRSASTGRHGLVVLRRATP